MTKASCAAAPLGSAGLSSGLQPDRVLMHGFKQTLAWITKTFPERQHRVALLEVAFFSLPQQNQPQQQEGGLAAGEKRAHGAGSTALKPHGSAPAWAQ